jgi:TPR repeat protein
MQLSHENALSMYRENVKKTKSPEMQFGFGKHLIMLAADMRENENVEFNLEKESLSKGYIEEGLNWIKQSGKSGNADASFYLAVCHEKGKNVKENKEKAYNYFLQVSFVFCCQFEPLF